VIGMKTPHDMLTVANAEGIGQLAQAWRGGAAFDAVLEIADQAQEARTLAFDPGGCGRSPRESARRIPNAN
jgi:hypothetical protein